MDFVGDVLYKYSGLAVPFLLDRQALVGKPTQCPGKCLFVGCCTMTFNIICSGCIEMGGRWSIIICRLRESSSGDIGQPLHLVNIYIFICRILFLYFAFTKKGSVP